VDEASADEAAAGGGEFGFTGNSGGVRAGGANGEALLNDGRIGAMDVESGLRETDKAGQDGANR